MLTTVNSYQVRQNFGEFLERSFYRGNNFLIKRGKKPMAYLVGRPYLSAFFDLLKKDKGLADTMALMLNQKASEMIDKGLDDYKKGKTVSINKLLE